MLQLWTVRCQLPWLCAAAQIPEQAAVQELAGAMMVQLAAAQRQPALAAQRLQRLSYEVAAVRAQSLHCCSLFT